MEYLPTFILSMSSARTRRRDHSRPEFVETVPSAPVNVSAVEPKNASATRSCSLHPNVGVGGIQSSSSSGKLEIVRLHSLHGVDLLVDLHDRHFAVICFLDLTPAHSTELLPPACDHFPSSLCCRCISVPFACERDFPPKQISRRRASRCLVSR